MSIGDFPESLSQAICRDNASREIGRTKSSPRLLGKFRLGLPSCLVGLRLSLFFVDCLLLLSRLRPSYMRSELRPTLRIPAWRV